MPSGSIPFARCILRSKPQLGRFGVILFQTDRYGSFCCAWRKSRPAKRCGPEGARRCIGMLLQHFSHQRVTFLWKGEVKVGREGTGEDAQLWRFWHLKGTSFRLENIDERKTGARFPGR